MLCFKIEKLWREYRCKLWNEFYDPLVSRNELIRNYLENVNMDQWAIFVDYRLKPSTMVQVFQLVYLNQLHFQFRNLFHFYFVGTV